jgi:hypothetical protein
MSKTRKAKAPAWLRRRFQEQLGPNALSAAQRGTVVDALRPKLRDKQESQSALLDELDALVKVYRMAADRKASYPSASVQRTSADLVIQCVACLRSALKNSEIDAETRKRLYLSLGRSDGSDEGLVRFARGKERVDRWLDKITNAAEFAQKRVRTRRGPAGHEELRWLVHELAEIWVRETGRRFVTTKNTTFSTTGDKLIPRAHLGRSQQSRRFVETILHIAKERWDDDALTYVMKEVAKERKTNRENTEDDSASDINFGR